MNSKKTLVDLIGKTPILRLTNYEKSNNVSAKIFAKLEYLNPIGSVKDRTAFAMVSDAEKAGILKPGYTIIEPTSGNTGIALAALAASRGYKIILTMPENMSLERQKLLKAYGATVILTDMSLGMKGAIAKANSLHKEISNSYIPSQFENSSNPKIHELTTGPEIWEDTSGQVDVFVSGVGTGGTISGAGSFLKSKKPKLKIVAVEPFDSPVLSVGKSGPHSIQGIGAGFVPKILDRDVYDIVITVKNEDAYTATKALAKIEGLLVGISSGAALHAATEISCLKEHKNVTIVVIFPDSGEKYLSTGVFD